MPERCSPCPLTAAWQRQDRLHLRRRARVHAAAGLDRHLPHRCRRQARAGEALKPKRTAHSAIWNGKIDGRPAPAGTYLAGITAQNPACDQASWPIVLPPAAGTTPHAGVSVRYLSVTPPLTPTVSGSRTSVAVDSPDASYTWKLRRSGTAKVLAHGAGAAGTHPHRRAYAAPPGRALHARRTLRRPQRGGAARCLAGRARGVDGARAGGTADAQLDRATRRLTTAATACPTRCSGGTGVTLSRPLVDGPPASLGDDADAAQLPE